MVIKISDLTNLVSNVLRSEYSQEEARLIQEVVLFGELSGRSSHGILRLIKENYGVFVKGKRGKPEYIHKTKVSTLIDGKGNPGMLIGPLAMIEAIRLAQEQSIGIVGTKGSFNSIGALSYYCEQIASKNYIGVIFAQAAPDIAPFNSRVALFGTNPIAFSIPSVPHPIIFDMSTSAITRGSLIKYKAEGLKIPINTAIDNEGNITTDPQKALDGATLPFDASYKGSGLAMMVEMLAALWPGASYEGMHEEDGWGNVFMVLSPDLLSNTDTLKKKSQEFIEKLKSSPVRDGKPIRIPGDRTLGVMEENIRKEEIEIDDRIYTAINKQMNW